MHKPLLLAAAVLAASAVPALADPAFTVTGVSVQGDIVTINGPSAPENAYAGPLTLTTAAGAITAWCVDLYHTIQTGTGQSLRYQYGAATTDNAPTPSALSATQQSEIANLASYGQSLLGTAAGTTDALTAVQLAIWSVEYPTFSYSGAPGASVADALRHDASGPGYDIGLLALDGTQTFVTGVTSTNATVSPVPEPGSLALLAGGLALAGLAARRRAGAAI